MTTLAAGLLVIPVIALAGVAPEVAAQPAPRQLDDLPGVRGDGRGVGPGEGRGVGRGPLARLAQLDRDGDGQLTAEELGPLAERLARFDLNGDGILTRAELTAAVRARASGEARAAPTPPEGRDRRRAGETPGLRRPGQGSPEQGSPKQGSARQGTPRQDSPRQDSPRHHDSTRPWFQRADRNGDGVLSADEAPRVVARCDADGDGVVTRAEWAAQLRARLRQRWTMLDSDSNGRIDATEFRGTPERFQRLDRNGDGFLDAQDRPQRPARSPDRAARRRF